MKGSILAKTAKILKGTGLVWLFLISATLVVLFIGGILENEASHNAKSILRGGGIIIAGLCIIYFLSKKQIDIYKELVSTISIRLNSIKWFFNIILICFLFFSLCFLIAGLFDLYSIKQFTISRLYDRKLIKHFILVAVTANILASIGEEILFRGYLLNYFCSFLQKRKVAIILSSLIFSIGHLHYQDTLNFVLAFAGGITAAYGYLKFRTISIPIGIHFAYNLFNFIVASNTGEKKVTPYVFNIDYVRIAQGFGAWVDFFILLAFVFIFVYLYYKKIQVGSLYSGRMLKVFSSVSN